MGKEKIKKPFYKKWWVWLVAIIVIFAIAGGGEDSATEVSTGSQENATKETKKSEPKKEEAPKTAGIGEPVKVGDVTFTAHSTSTAKNVGGEYGQDAQGTYLIVEVTVKNESKEAITTDSSFFKLKSDGAEYEADAIADIYVNGGSNSFFLQKINPGNESKGKIAFDVNDNVINAKDTLLNVQTGFFGTEQGEIKIVK